MTIPTPPALARYRIEEPLGKGALSVVFRAIDAASGDKVAVKVIRSELLDGEDRRSLLARFRLEGEIGTRLVHPRVIRVRDWGEDQGVAYMCMDHIEGRDLRRHLEEGGTPPVEEVAGLMDQLLDALAYVHRNGVVHRDIKPGNIMLKPDGGLVLMDFGVAHVDGAEMTSLGEVVGTPEYMAPEQLQGLEVDGRADLFACGALLYRLLTGRRPFNGSMATIMHQVLTVDPPPVSAEAPALGGGFDAIVAKALAKRPRDRFPDAEALRRAIAAVPLASRPVAGGVASAASAPVSPRAAADRLADILRRAVSRGLDGTALAEARRDISSLAGRPSELAALAGQHLPALAAKALATAPLPGARPVERLDGPWLGLVELFQALDQASDRRAEAARAGLVGALVDAFPAYADRLTTALFGDDHPDLLSLSMEFLRLDVLDLALDALDATVEKRAVRGYQRLYAGQVVRKVNALISSVALGAATGEERALARFAVAALLVDVEELIVLADRLLEKDARSWRAGGPEALGEQALVELIGNLALLARLVVEELEEQAGREGAENFSGRLKQLALLYAFASRIDEPSCAQALRELVTEVRRAIERLTRGLAARVEEEDAERLKPVLAHLMDLHELARTLRWEHMGRFILAALRDHVARPA